MYSHVFTNVTDFDRPLRFHGAVMAVLGHVPRFCEPGAYFRDPDGNKFCVARHVAEVGA